MRLYKFMPDRWAVSALIERRLKISFATEVNDLFELMPLDFGSGIEGRHLRETWSRAIKEHAHDQGFVCLSEDWITPTMWAHYANNHAGACLGFEVNVDEKIKSSAIWEKVVYVESLMKIDTRVLSDHTYNKDIVARARTTKSNHWSYEKEWRAWCTLRLRTRSGS